MTRLRSDEILVVDVESTCWSGDPPKGQRSEIIEIGACLVSAKTMEMKKSSSTFVKPTSSSVSEFCLQLTGITQQDVESGRSLSDACKWIVSEFDAPFIAWGSYGDYDRNQFRRNCCEVGVRYPFSDRHYNIKALLTLCKGWGEEVGMEVALKRLNLPLAGTHHRALADANNIASILKHIMSSCRVK